jgi:hypothetical protein
LLTPPHAQALEVARRTDLESGAEVLSREDLYSATRRGDSVLTQHVDGTRIFCDQLRDDSDLQQLAPGACRRRRSFRPCRPRSHCAGRAVESLSRLVDWMRRNSLVGATSSPDAITLR